MGVSQLSSDRAVSTWHFPLMPVLLMLVQHLQHDGNHQKTWSIISVQLSCMQLSQGFPTKKMHPQLYCYARYLFVHAIYNGHSKAEVLKQVKFYHQMPACGTLQTTNVIQISRLLYRLTMLLLPRLLIFLFGSTSWILSREASLDGKRIDTRQGGHYSEMERHPLPLFGLWNHGMMSE